MLFFSVVQVFFYDPEMQKILLLYVLISFKLCFFFKEITTICLHVLYIYFQAYIITTYFAFFLYTKIASRFFTI